MTRRRIAVGALVAFLAAGGAGYAWLLRTIPLEATALSAAGAALPPAAGRTTRLVVPLQVTREAIAQKLEAVVPRSDAGVRPDPFGGAIRDDAVEWNFSRSPLNVTTGNGRLTVGATISGTVRARGVLQPIRGSGGGLLRDLGLAPDIPFSAHADLTASVEAAAAPQLAANWRLVPNFSARGSVSEARIPILDITHISVRGEVQPKLDEALAKLTAELNAKVGNDPFLENAVRREWQKLCAVHLIRIPNQPEAFLTVVPQAVSAAQPVLDAEGLKLTVGIEAILAIGASNAPLPCPPLPPVLTLLPQPPAAAIEVALPATLPFTDLNQRLAALFARPQRIKRNGFYVVIKGARLVPAGNRIVTILDVDTGEDRFLGLKASGTVAVSAVPRLDGDTIRFADPQVDEASLGVFGAGARVIGSIIAASYADRAVFPLSEAMARARAAAQAGLDTLAARAKPELDITARVDEVRLTDIAFDATHLRVITVARGAATIKALSLAIGN